MSDSRTVLRDPAEPLRAPLVIHDNFLPNDLAMAMRADIDAHFANPDSHGPDTHQVWNYWFVPELYAYLRTRPEKIIRRDRVEAFVQTLRRWSLATLGMGQVTWPFLSLYVPGCRQGWHNDAVNGRFGFVYSLTRNRRRTIGGATLVLHEGDPFRANLERPTAGAGLYETVEPGFNRLVVFDDRLTHSVERIDGAMDPVEGRFVMHGHLSEAGTVAVGALPASAVGGPIAAALHDFLRDRTAHTALYHGPLAVQLAISAAGAVNHCRVLLDRVVTRGSNPPADWIGLRQELVACLSALTFPAAEGDTAAIQPVVFGDPLRTTNRDDRSTKA